VTTYADHAAAALRFGALTLSLPTPTSAGDVARVRLLQDDVAAVLAETTRTVTGLTPGTNHVTDVANVGHHPVRHMLKRLTVIPTRGGYDDPTTSPAIRLAGRPDDPAAVTTPVQAWQGLLAQIALAGRLLRTHAARMFDADRWAVVADVAALAQVLATTRVDVLSGQGNDLSVRHARDHAAALGVEAREVSRLAGAAGQDVGNDLASPKPGAAMVTVSRARDLPVAVAHLTALIDTRECSVTDLLAITRVTAQTSRACAYALLSAAPLAPPEQRQGLRVIAGALDAHAESLARALIRERARLTAPSDPTGLLAAQGREIGASALPRIQDLRRNPKAALAATDPLLGYAGRAPSLTRAIRGAVRHAATHGDVAVLDRSDDAGNYWRPATVVDLAPFTDDLTTAATTGTAPRGVLSAARAAASAGPAAQPGRDLAAALEQRLAEHRPARPSGVALRIHPPARPVAVVRP